MLPRALHPNMGRIRALFEQGLRLTQHDIEARVFVSVRNAREYLKILHAAGEIYIAEHRRDSPHGPATPVFALRIDEDQKDVPRPRRLTNNEVRARIRKSEEFREKEARAQRIKRAAARYAREGGVKVKDPLMAALVGTRQSTA